jgi:type IV secretory pathway VirB10-like protein
MFSRPLAFILLALGCVTAAAGGAYVATRHNSTDGVAATVSVANSAPLPAVGAPAQPATQPVSETEAPVSSMKAEKPEPTAEAPASPRTPASAASRRQEATKSTSSAPAPRNARTEPAPHTASRTVPANGASPSGQPEPQSSPVQAAPPPPAPEAPKPVEPQPEAPRVPQFEEVILPASSVIGLQMESTVSSERARLEDRVEARVTRDVLAAGRVAIPAGSRVVGSVTMIDKGGKVKQPARLGIRFHTLILTDGSEVALHTEPIYREGESPAGSSAKKIGGAAIGGAILGGILGGGKGAVIGGSTGAAGGTAAVMAGDRNAVVLTPGTLVTAKLSAPATITVERRN